MLGRQIVMPKVRSRLLAVVVSMYVIGAASYAWGLWRNGLVGVLLLSGAPGYVLAAHWFVALAAGPFGCVQLWRGRPSGRIACIAVVVSGLVLDVVLYLLADAGQWLAQLPSITPKTAMLLLLAFGLREQRHKLSDATAA